VEITDEAHGGTISALAGGAARFVLEPAAAAGDAPTPVLRVAWTLTRRSVAGGSSSTTRHAASSENT
jgi:hypothetical protein